MLQDASSEVRQAARATFGAFASRWPARAAALKATLQASSWLGLGLGLTLTLTLTLTLFLTLTLTLTLTLSRPRRRPLSARSPPPERRASTYATHRAGRQRASSGPIGRGSRTGSGAG